MHIHIYMSGKYQNRWQKMPERTSQKMSPSLSPRSSFEVWHEPKNEFNLNFSFSTFQYCSSYLLLFLYWGLWEATEGRKPVSWKTRHHRFPRQERHVLFSDLGEAISSTVTDRKQQQVDGKPDEWWMIGDMRPVFWFQGTYYYIYTRYILIY